MAAGELHHRSEATLDQLTGLLNRRGLTDRLDELSQQAEVINDGTPLALIACDLDHFKHINDTYGHARGDDVLRDVAYLIRKRLRRFELAYRLGGEEFLVVLPGHDVATATALAEPIRVAIENGRPGGLHVTISMGVAVPPAASVDVAGILEDADAAMHIVKRNGRNRVETTTPPADSAVSKPRVAEPVSGDLTRAELGQAEGLTQRGGAHRQRLGQLVLRQARTGGQGTPEDQAADFSVRDDARAPVNTRRAPTTCQRTANAPDIIHPTNVT